MIKKPDREAIKKKQAFSKKRIASAVAQKQLEKYINNPHFQKFNLLPMGWETERGLNHPDEIFDYFQKMFRKYAPETHRDLAINFLLEKDKEKQEGFYASSGKFGKQVNFKINEKINGNLLDKHMPKIIKQITVLHEVSHVLTAIENERAFLQGNDRRLTRAYESTEGHDALFADKYNWLVEKEFGIKNWNFPKITTKKQFEKVQKNHYLIPLYKKKYGYENDFWAADEQHPIGNFIFEPTKILTFYGRFLHEAKLELEDLKEDKTHIQKNVRNDIQSNIVDHFKLLYNMRLKLDTFAFKTNPEANVVLRNFIKQVKKNIIAFRNINIKEFKKKSKFSWKASKTKKRMLIKEFSEHFKHYTEADWERDDRMNKKRFLEDEAFHKKYIKENLIWIKKAKLVAHLEKTGIEKPLIKLNATNKKR